MWVMKLERKGGKIQRNVDAKIFLKHPTVLLQMKYVNHLIPSILKRVHNMSVKKIKQSIEYPSPLDVFNTSLSLSTTNSSQFWLPKMSPIPAFWCLHFWFMVPLCLKIEREIDFAFLLACRANHRFVIDILIIDLQCLQKKIDAWWN